MACYENSVTTFQGKKAKLYVCAVNNGIYVDFVLRGDPKESAVIRGYTQVILERVNKNEAWVQVSSQNEGLWADSTLADKSGKIYNSYTSGDLVRVIVKVYSDANYKYLIDAASTNAFERR